MEKKHLVGRDTGRAPKAKDVGAVARTASGPSLPFMRYLLVDTGGGEQFAPLFAKLIVGTTR